MSFHFLVPSSCCLSHQKWKVVLSFPILSLCCISYTVCLFARLLCPRVLAGAVMFARKRRESRAVDQGIFRALVNLPCNVSPNCQSQSLASVLVCKQIPLLLLRSILWICLERMLLLLIRPSDEITLIYLISHSTSSICFQGISTSPSVCLSLNID